MLRVDNVDVFICVDNQSICCVVKWLQGQKPGRNDKRTTGSRVIQRFRLDASRKGYLLFLSPFSKLTTMDKSVGDTFVYDTVDSRANSLDK